VFSKRVIRPELLDHAEPDEARENLADLVRINRFFGGHSTLRKLFSAVVTPGDRFTVLDVGAASGDSARFIQELYPAACVTSLDNNSVNLEAAPPPKLIADAFEIPFAPGSFDFVTASLFLHHFSNEQIISLLRNFHEVARRGILISDLERRLLPYLFLKLSKPFLGWKRITVHDGLISVRAAFRKDELAGLARAAGIANLEVVSHRPAFRLTLMSVKQ